jgi:PAS domain S-box-containing protein
MQDELGAARRRVAELERALSGGGTAGQGPAVAAFGQSEEVLRLALRNSGVIIFLQDLDLRYSWVCGPHPDLTPETVVGRTDADLVPEANAGPLVELKQRVIDSGVEEKAVMRFSFTEEPSFYQVTLRPWRDVSGAICGISGVTYDITERMEAERALNVSEARFRTIFEHAPVLIDAFDADGRCVLWNKECEKTFGWTLEELNASEDPLALFYPDPATKQQVLETVTSLPKRVFREWHPVTSAGIPIVSMWANFELPDEGVINIGYDITELRRLEERRRAETEQRRMEEARRKLDAQLQHAQKLESLGVLAGGIAHDFNNLLMTILGNADLALNKLPDQSPAQRFIQGVINASRQAAGLTNQMLAYSGKGQFTLERLDLSTLVESVASLLESSVPKKGGLRLELSSDLPAFEGDPSQIRQVIMNLVINGADALHGAAGQVAVRTAKQSVGRSSGYLTTDLEPLPEGEYVVLEVSDTGEGMDPPTKQKIFDPFFTTKFTGRGLGLAAVQGIVRGHLAGVSIDTAVGKGTTIQVLFPALSDSAESVTDHVSGEGGWRGSGTVLVVDDEADVRTLVSEMLRELGLSVLEAADGAEAVEVFQDRHAEIDCVLLDMQMPRMDGTETSDALRRIRADVPILLSSGYSESESTGRFQEKRLAGFIQKPYELATLRAKLGQVLA